MECGPLKQTFRRLPQHVGIIPDGNRRWAERHNLPKEAGYAYGIKPGLELFKLCLELGIPELTYYGFTHDNTKRPTVQKEAFTQACIEAVRLISKYDAALLVVGNYHSPAFPKELLPYTVRRNFGRARIKLNFLVNYDWQWDLFQACVGERAAAVGSSRDFRRAIGSADVSRIDLIVRWGGRRRLSGLLPVQTIYSDMYVLDELWPDYHPEQFIRALRWYEQQDVTLGG